MWIFINESKPAIRYSLTEGQTYNIGRVPSNEISIGNDVSISRVHGTIFVEVSNDIKGLINCIYYLKYYNILSHSGGGVEFKK